MQPSSKASTVRASLCKKIELVRQLFKTFHEKERGLRTKEAETGKKRDPVDILAKTEFEEVGVTKRPAVSLLRKKSSVRWKTKPSRDKPTKEATEKKEDSQATKKEGKQPTDMKDMAITDVIQHREFRLARKIIDEVHKAKMMEKLLNEEDTATMRKFIETELASPSYKEVRLLHRALNQLWEDVMCNLTQFHFEQDVLVFLCEREKAKARFLDVMLICPSSLPDSWGGGHICEITEIRPGMLITSAATPACGETSVIPPPVVESIPSQWTKVVKGMVDENKLKIPPVSSHAEKHSRDAGQRMEDAGLRKVRVRKSKSSKKEEKKGKEESADGEKRKQKDDGTAAKNLQKPLQEIATPRQQPLKEASSESLEKKIGESVLKEIETRDYDRVDTKELNEYLRELENLKGNTCIGNENKKEVKSDDEPHGIESFIELYSSKNGDEEKKKEATRREKKKHEKKSVHEVGKSEKHECLKSLAKTQEDDSLKEPRGKSLESPKVRIEKKDLEVDRETVDKSSKKMDIKGSKQLDERDSQKQQKEQEHNNDKKDKVHKEGNIDHVKEVDVAESLKTSSSKTNRLKKEEESKSIKKEESFKSAKAYREGEKTQEELQELNKEEVDRAQKGLLKQEKPPVEPKSTAVKGKVEGDPEVKESEKGASKKGADTDVKEGKPEAQKEQDKKAGELKKIASETKVGGDTVEKRKEKKEEEQKDKGKEPVIKKGIASKQKSGSEKDVKEELQKHERGEGEVEKSEVPKIGKIIEETETQKTQRVPKQKNEEEKVEDVVKQKEKGKQERLIQERKADETKKLRSNEKLGDSEDTEVKEKRGSQQGQVKETKKVESKENVGKEKDKEHGFRKSGSKELKEIVHKQQDGNVTREKSPTNVFQRVRRSKDAGKHDVHHKEEHKKEIKERKVDSKRQEDKAKDPKTRRKKSSKKG